MATTNSLMCLFGFLCAGGIDHLESIWVSGSLFGDRDAAGYEAAAAAAAAASSFRCDNDGVYPSTEPRIHDSCRPTTNELNCCHRGCDGVFVRRCAWIDHIDGCTVFLNIDALLPSHYCAAWSNHLFDGGDAMTETYQA